MAYEKLNSLVKTIQELQEYNTDSVVGISGSEGTGKSTLTLQFLRRLLYPFRKDSELRFNLERNVAFTAGEVDRKLRMCPENTGLNIDEAGRLFYMRDAMTKLTREGVKLFQQIRFRKLAIFLNIPPFFSLDKEIRNKRIWLWIHVTSKGHALYFLRDENVFTPDPWHAKENADIIKRWYKGPVSGSAALTEGYRRTINYIDEFEFPKLPADIDARYSELSHAKKLKPDEVVKPTRREQVLVKRLRRTTSLLHLSGYTRTELAELSGVGVSMLTSFLARTPELPSVAAWADRPDMADVLLPWRKEEERAITAESE